MAEHAPLLVVPIPSESEKLIIMPAADAPKLPPASLATDPEQARAVEALFAAKEQESEKVAALLGLWTGTAILRDLAVDTFTEPAGEVEAERQKQPKKPIS